MWGFVNRTLGRRFVQAVLGNLVKHAGRNFIEGKEKFYRGEFFDLSRGRKCFTGGKILWQRHVQNRE